MKAYAAGMSATEMIGMRFCRLVINRAVRDGRRYLFLVECDCGKTKTVARNHLVGGRVKSCGCLRVESTIRTHTTHGMTGSKLYSVWASMVNRATKKHPNYAGRGIGICEEWLTFV